MRILLINPNTDLVMTEQIRKAAGAFARHGTEIMAIQPDWGPMGLDSVFDGLLAAAAVIEKLASIEFTYDAVIFAGFGDPGSQALREFLDVPVFDIAECAAHLACLVGRAYAVLTTLVRSVPQIEDALRVAGLRDRCAGVRAIGVETNALANDVAATRQRLIEQGHRAIQEDRAEVIVLGCGGLGGLDKDLEDHLRVPVIDGIVAAVKSRRDAWITGFSLAEAASMPIRCQR